MCLCSGFRIKDKENNNIEQDNVVENKSLIFMVANRNNNNSISFFVRMSVCSYNNKLQRCN